MQRSLTPYSPSNRTEQGSTSLVSLTIALTKYETEAPGAYQADVPRSLVKVAPPTIVSEAIFETSSSDRILVSNLLLHLARDVSGIIVVSP